MGNFTLNINDPRGPFQVHLHINKSYSAIACVKFPYSLLYGQWIWNEILGVISCSDCNLTQCINRSGGNMLKTRWSIPIITLWSL